MKRYKGLMPRLCEWEHLYTAFKRAKRGSGRSKACLAFQYDLENQLLLLQEELQTGTYQPRAYRHFYIYDPKKRKISVAAFRDRVVHHAIVALLEPIYEPCFIFHSYATRKNKGTHKAIAQSQQYLRLYKWFFKADIEQYFASIDHKILMDLLRKKVKDKVFLNVVERIVSNGGSLEKGLPIGNLTSQFFANVYLNPFDHYIKSHLGIKAYVRYMDDFVVWTNCKADLKQLKLKLAYFLDVHLQLALKPSACFLNQRANGLSFLGARIFPSVIRIHRANLKRVLNRIQKRKLEFEAGMLDEETFLQSLQSSWAYIQSFDTVRLRQQLIGQLAL